MSIGPRRVTVEEPQGRRAGLALHVLPVRELPQPLDRELAMQYRNACYFGKHFVARGVGPSSARPRNFYI